MAGEKVVVLFDLDGVLATRDIAFDLFKAHGWGTRFSKTSNEIATAVNSGKSFRGGKPYAGQTIKAVMDDALASGVKVTEAEIRKLASEARLMRGSKSLISALKKNPRVENVFIISTTYKPAAEEIAKRVGIPKENVFATKLELSSGQVSGTSGPACGGVHKANAVDRVSRLTKTPVSRMVIVGDSITDIGMMDRVVKAGGLGIAFNANNDLLMRKPNVVYAGRTLKPAYGIMKAFIAYGHAGVKKVVDRNIKLRRVVGVPMSMLGRPFLFRPGVKDAKAMKKSGTFRAKVRSKKIARLR